MSKTYLIIDIGTGNTKIHLIDSAGNVHGKRSFSNYYHRDDRYPDALYFQPDAWEEHIMKAISSLLSDFPNRMVDAISASGARQTVVLIDKKGVCRIGLPNIDNRAKEYMGELRKDSDVYRRTGKWVTEDFPAAKMMGFQKKYPEEFEEIRTFTSLSEWVGYFLTGRLCIEPTQAGETQLFNIHTRKFEDDLAKMYGIDSLQFPTVQDAGSCLGEVSKKWTESLPTLVGAKFIVGGADTQIAISSAEPTAQDYAVVSGTTTPICTFSSEAIYDKKERIWVDCDLEGRGYYFEVNPGSTGLNYQRFLRTFLPGADYVELESAYQKMDHIKVVSSLTSLQFTDKIAQKSGGFFTKAPFPEDLGPVDFSWAILADIACAISSQIWSLEDVLRENQVSEAAKKQMLGIGGGFQSPTLCQMLSDLMGKPLMLSANYVQETSYGLVRLCNQYFKIELKGKKPAQSILPKKGALIQEYYTHWKQYRK